MASLFWMGMFNNVTIYVIFIFKLIFFFKLRMPRSLKLNSLLMSEMWLCVVYFVFKMEMFLWGFWHAL